MRTPKAREQSRPNWTIVTTIAAVVLFVIVGILLTGCSGDLAGAQKAAEAGDMGAASSLYQKQLQAHPNDLGALKGLAGILYVERRWNEALPVQEKVVALDAKEAQIRVELGFNYLNHQDAAGKAVVVFREAAALEHTAQHLGFLAQAEMAAGDSQAGEASLREALTVDKTYVRAYDLLINLLVQQGRTADAAAVRDAAQSAGVALDPGAATSGAT
jgi:Tfp pilus assembly protein PilF